jgi:hypothetical protein
VPNIGVGFKMARQINQLSARGAATKGAGLHADGAGLYLRVDPAGARRWIFIFRYRGKRCEMGLGPSRLSGSLMLELWYNRPGESCEKGIARSISGAAAPL